VTYPLITLSTRAQVDAKGEHRSITKALKKILDKEGVPGLYAGLKSALFGIGITNGI
jgi:adenine nucleotide transporter 17